MNQKTSASSKAMIAAIIGNTFWGFSFMASRTALNRASVIQLLSHRFLIAFVLMTFLCFTPAGDFHLRGEKPRPIWPLFLLGLFQPVIYFIGEQYGILHSSTIFSGVMIAMIPIVSTLAAIPVLGEKPSARQLFCSLLSVGGVIGIGLLTRSRGHLDQIGVITLLIAVFSAVAYVLLSRGISGSYTPFERTYGMFALGAMVFTGIAMISFRGNLTAYFSPFKEPTYVMALLFLSVCCSIVSYFVTNYVLTRLTITRATVFNNLTTAVSVFAGAFFLHEPFSLSGFFYCVLILLGIYGVQKGARS